MLRDELESMEVQLEEAVNKKASQHTSSIVQSLTNLRRKSRSVQWSRASLASIGAGGIGVAGATQTTTSMGTTIQGEDHSLCEAAIEELEKTLRERSEELNRFREEFTSNQGQASVKQDAWEAQDSRKHTQLCHKLLGILSVFGEEVNTGNDVDAQVLLRASECVTKQHDAVMRTRDLNRKVRDMQITIQGREGTMHRPHSARHREQQNRYDHAYENLCSTEQTQSNVTVTALQRQTDRLTEHGLRRSRCVLRMKP
eukprot:Clim_evm22s238 gene=Clim_evmTU22s238